MEYRIPSNRLSPKKRRESNPIGITELVKIIKHIKRPDVFMAVFMSWAFGLRREEVINLKCADISIENKQVKVVQGKYSKDRYIPIIDDRYIEIIQNWLKKNKDEYFVTSYENKSKRLSKTVLYKYYSNALKEVKLDVVEYHAKGGKPRYKHNFHSLNNLFSFQHAYTD